VRCCANNSSVIRSSPEALGATLAPALSAQRPMTKIRIASSYVRPRALPTNRCPARDDMLSSVGRVWRAKLHRAGRRFPASGRGLRASAVSTTNRHRSRAIPVRPRVGPRVAPAHGQASPNMISFCCEHLLIMNGSVSTCGSWRSVRASMASLRGIASFTSVSMTPNARDFRPPRFRRHGIDAQYGATAR